jgi:hypothetical protein
MFIHFSITAKRDSFCSSFRSRNRASLLGSTSCGRDGLNRARRRVSNTATPISIHIMDFTYSSGICYRCCATAETQHDIKSDSMSGRNRRFDSRLSTYVLAIIGMAVFRIPLHTYVLVQAYNCALRLRRLVLRRRTGRLGLNPRRVGWLRSVTRFPPCDSSMGNNSCPISNPS